MGEKRNVHRYFMGKLRGKRPLKRPRLRWIDDNNNLELGVIGCDCMNWTGVVQDKYQWRALVNAAKKLRVP
jgi:hypothetical protein